MVRNAGNCMTQGRILEIRAGFLKNGSPLLPSEIGENRFTYTKLCCMTGILCAHL